MIPLPGIVVYHADPKHFFSFLLSMADRGIEIVVKGAVDVSISATLITAQGATHTFKNNVLTITGTEGVSSTGVVAFNGTTSSRGAVCMNGMTIRAMRDTLYIDGRIPRNVVINGVTVRSNEAAPPARVEMVHFPILNGGWIRTIATEAAGDIRVENNVFSASNDLDIITTGSGCIDLSTNRVKSLRVRLIGAGEVVGSVVAEGATLRLSGSGEIRGVHGKNFVIARLTGAGEIHATAGVVAAVDKTVTGVGKVTIKRIQRE